MVYDLADMAENIEQPTPDQRSQVLKNGHTLSHWKLRGVGIGNVGNIVILLFLK